MRAAILFLSSTSVALGLAACGGGSDGAGGSGGTGGSSGESCQAFDGSITAALKAWDDVPTAGGSEVAIDTTSCLDGTPTGTVCGFLGQVKDFAEKDTQEANLGDTTVVVFPSNQIADPSVLADPETNCEPATSGVTNATCYWAKATAHPDRFVEFPSIECNKPFAVWASKISTLAPITKPAVQFDFVVPDGAATVRQDILTISDSTYKTVPGIVGFSTNPQLGIVAGQVADCADAGIQNASVHVVEGRLDTAPAGFCGTDPIDRVGTFYFVDNFPEEGQTVTSEDGLWGFANVPPGDVTVFAFSNEGGTLTSIGSVQLVALPDTITIADVVIDH